MLADSWGVWRVASKVGAARQTRHAWLARYEAEGLEGLKARSQRHHRVSASDAGPGGRGAAGAVAHPPIVGVAGAGARVSESGCGAVAIGVGESMVGLLHTPGVVPFTFTTDAVTTLRHALSMFQTAGEKPSGYTFCTPTTRRASTCCAGAPPADS